jgi:hypothetical protein
VAPVLATGDPVSVVLVTYFICEELAFLNTYSQFILKNNES